MHSALEIMEVSQNPLTFMGVWLIHSIQWLSCVIRLCTMGSTAWPDWGFGDLLSTECRVQVRAAE